MSRTTAGLPLRMLTYTVLTPLILASTVICGSVSLLCGLWDRSGRQQHWIAQVWAKTLLKIALAPVTVVGIERLGRDLRAGASAVYASNHLSYYDTPVLFSSLPFQFRIVAKQALWKVPFIGWYLNRSGQVPVDQKNARSTIASLGRGVKALQSGMPLVLFPEGGRAFDGKIQSFMSGAAFMAIKSGVPLVPIALIGTYELLPIHIYHLTPRPLIAVIGDPIPTTGLTTKDANALTEKLREAISGMYHQYQAPFEY